MGTFERPIALTDRVVLKPWDLSMADEMVRVVRENAAHLRTWLNWPESDYGILHAERFIQQQLDQVGTTDGISVGLWEGSLFLGAVTMNHVDLQNRSTYLGYWLSATVRGRGFMTMAVRVVVDTLLGDRGYRRVVIAMDPRNVKSRAIPERLGFTQEGILRDVYRHRDCYIDWVIYAMLAPDWIRQRTQSKEC